MGVLGPLLLFLALLPALAAAQVPTPSPYFPAAPPEAVRGAVLWLHGHYNVSSQPTPPPEPPIIARFAARGWAIWRLDRTPGRDPLAAGGTALIAGLTTLRQTGYRKLIVAGFSRGAFIALAALREPDLADGFLLLSPAAHGTRPERRPQAMADYAAALDAMPVQPRLRVLLAQFAGDEWDPDPPGRRDRLFAACARSGCQVQSIFEPPSPLGHGGGNAAEFDRLFGEQIARFLDP